MQSNVPLFKAALAAALAHALRHLENLDSTSVAAQADVHTLRSRLSKSLADQGVPAEQVVEDLARDVRNGIIGSAGGRFFGWVIGGTLPAALAADWLTSSWDQNAGLYACAPAAAVCEEVVGGWLKDILGLPDHASFALVTGCQMAHVTCLAAARHALLELRGWDVEKQGLYGAPAIRILCNGERHGTIERAIRFLGLGLAHVTDLATDATNRIADGALEEALKRDSASPTIVVLQAGDICTGGYDKFATLIPLAKSHGAWVHIDGAFGLWGAASPRYRHLLQGVEQADSWTTDGHKWLNVPFDCAYAFVANESAHRASMSHRAAYVTHDTEARDQMDWNPEWSRRARGFPTYAALRQLGRDGIADLVDRCCRHARSLVEQIGKLPGAEIVFEPVINQGLLRFHCLDRGSTEQDHDRRTDEIMASVLASGEAFFTGSVWRGKRVMRVSVCNWCTCERDVERAVSAVAEALKVTGFEAGPWQTGAGTT
jgi:glutamate/tyrosine decarboxylase-like PLP-dependent enzyme